MFSLAIGLNASHDWILPSKNWGISEWHSQTFKTGSVAKSIWGKINTKALFCCKKRMFVLGHSLTVPQSSQFSSSCAFGGLFAFWKRRCPRTSIREYFHAKWKLLLPYPNIASGIVLLKIPSLPNMEKLTRIKVKTPPPPTTPLQNKK